MKRRYAYLQPFSHLMGSSCLIPTTSYVVQAFASKICIFDLECPTMIIKEFPLPSKGLLRQFTLLQDLEAGGVSCFSENYRFFITPQLDLLPKRSSLLHHEERLCLGVYKKQEVEAIWRRKSIREIFPLLFRLGSLLPIMAPCEKRSIFSLLEQCRQEQKPEKIEASFQRLYAAGFTPFLLPLRRDLAFQNLYSEEECDTPILALLAESARWIRSLFFLSGESFLQFLPKLPPECVFGKFYSLKSAWGRVDFEWSKKQLFSLQIHVEKEGELELRLPPELKRFRVTKKNKKYQAKRGDPLEVKQGQLIILDRFEK